VYESCLILTKNNNLCILSVPFILPFVLPLDLISSCLCSVLAFVLVGVHSSLFLGPRTLRGVVGASIGLLLTRFGFPAALLHS
jgi:hypothetical protein